MFSGFVILFAFTTKKDDDPLAKLTSALQNWTDSIPQEKVYLHMDKPYYALGDTIWFKGYVTIGSRHQLSALSGAVYVDLINDKDSVVKALKLPVTAGMVMGDFTLIDDYKEGSYRIRAYTQWMRNAGPEYFFDRTFTVGEIGGLNIVTKADYQYRQVNNEQVLTALLNFTNDEGKALAERSIKYEIVINKKIVWTQNAKTDALGSLSIKINNANKANLAGAYIRTTLDGSDKYPIIKDFPIKAAQVQTDVQFFPEGGSLINGISARVAFKAVGVNGLGINIKGKITDEDNKETADIETLHGGMGTFMFKPQAGKSYKANIIFADGTTKVFDLPKATDNGYVLSVYQPGKDSVLVRIKTPQQSLSQPHVVNLIAQTRGESIFASLIKINKSTTSVWLNKKDFPSGIAQFTLFNDAGEPINERIAFIKSNDQMQLDINTAKPVYKSKEHIKINLGAQDSKGKPTSGNFSVTVIDEGKMPVDENIESTILSNLLLTSDLKGYVEQPNYYFTKETDEVNRALDNLMLTQGYRRFAWKQLTATATPPLFKVEGLGAKIGGRVFTLSNKPMPNATVTLMSVIAGVTKFTTTDSVGRFIFDGIFMTDSIKFTIQARGAKNTDKVKMLIDKVAEQKLTPNSNLGDVSTNVAATLKQYLDNGKKLDDIYEQTGQLDKVHRLREVRIRARKPSPPPFANQGMYRIPEGHADQIIVMDPNDTIKTSIADWLPHQMKGVMFMPYEEIPVYPWALDLFAKPKPIYKPLNVILDGRRLEKHEVADVLNGYAVQPESIYKFEVVRTSPALLVTLGGASLMIFTKRDYVRKNYTPNTTNYSPKGFNKVREFYSPRYDKPGSGKLPDLRTTIYWNPYLKTDANGKTAFNFFNADGPGSYKVIVEGINADGELGRQVYRYTVDAGQATTTNYALPAADKNLAMITAPLDSFNKRFLAEKVHLHTDKPYYNIGDTLWFKAYLLDKVNLMGSKMSGLLYVELDNDSSEMVRRISIPIKDGLGWGQIPLTKAIFKDGSYTLRAYTNWMQNFGQDYVFNQRFYLGVPSRDTWLVRSAATLNRVAGKNQLDVDIKLNRPDDISSPVALKKVEVKIYDEWHYIYKETMQTGIDGSLKLSQALKDKADGRRIRVQITSLEKDDDFKVVQIPLDINRAQNLDLQFLPEGGNLVSGFKSTIGFKAISEDGKGTPVLGGIYDSKGAEIVSFAAIHNGMGSFEFIPRAGESYTARLLKPIAKDLVFAKINPSGTVLHLSNPEQGDNLNITLGGLEKLSTDSACYLIGMARGIVYYSQKLEPEQTDIAIAKQRFPTGIARFTLFKGNPPLNERAVFVDNHDQLSICIKPNKSTYNKRDSVGLEIEVKDKSGTPVTGSFSLAVTDDSQVKADSAGNNSIAVSLLLNSDLKGTIEDPGYYINRKGKQAWEALDNLMLTQGWTGYDWKDVFNKVNLKPTYKAEKELKVTGIVTNLAKKPIPNAQVLISSKKPSFIASTLADVDGRYEFKNLPLIDSGSFFLQVNNNKGKSLAFGNISVEKFRASPVPENVRNPVKPWYVNADSTQVNYVKRRIEKAEERELKLTGRVLKEVKINAKKIIPGSLNRNGPGRADLIFDEEDIKQSAVLNLYQLLKQKLPGFKVVMERNLPTVKYNKYLVVIHIDAGGLPIQLNPNASVEDLEEELSKFQIAQFKGMEVMYSDINMAKYYKPKNEWVSKHFTPKEILFSEMWLQMRLLPSDEELNEWNLKPHYGWIYDSGHSPGYLEARVNLLTNMPPEICVIDITTKGGNGWYFNRAPSAVTYRPLPVMLPQQFYHPKYNVKPLIIEPDYRSTLYWEPNINTDQNGKARVSFYTSDIKSDYTVKISGTDVTGGIGDVSFKIKAQPTLQ